MASSTYEITALALALLPASDRARSKDWRAYSLEWVPINAGQANVQAQFQVDTSIDFVALYATGEVTSTAAPPVENAAPQYTLQLNAADTKVFDKNVHWQNIAGSAKQPFPLPFPWWLSKGTTVTGLLTSLFNANENVRLTFHGFALKGFDRTTSRAY